MSFYYLTKKLAEVYHPESCEEVTRFIPGVPSGGGTGGGDEHCYETTVQQQVPIVSDGSGGLEVGNYGDGDLEGTITIDKVITVCTSSGIPDNASPVPGGYNVTEEVCTPEHTTLEPDVGWDASARSISTFVNDAKYEFQVDDNVSGVITGFSNQAIDDYLQIRWGLYLTGGRAHVVEFGHEKTGSFSYTSSDVFKIERIANVVYYYQDATLLYTSEDVDSGPLVGVAALYVSGERLNDATFTQLDQQGASVNDAQFATSYGSDKTDYGEADAQAATSDGQSYNAGDGDSDAQPAESYASDSSDYAYGESIAAPAESSGTNINNAPSYAVGDAVAGSGDSTGYGVVEVGGDGASDAGGAESLGGEYAEGEAAAGGAESQGWKVDGFIGTGIIRFPGFSVTGTGIDTRSALRIRLPAFSVSGNSGGDGRIKLPAFSLSSTGVNNGTGVGTIKLPAFSISGLGVNRGSAVGSIKLPAFSVSAFGSGSGNIKLPAFSVSAAGVVRFTATGSLRLPPFSVSATAQYHRAATGVIRLPAFKVSSGATGTIRLPAFKVLALGGEAATQQCAYVMNISNRAVTQWSHAPFKQAMRLGNRYFVLIGTTVYELAGTRQYDGSTINSEILTFSSDLGIPEMKSIPKSYFSARSYAGLEITPIVDEIESQCICYTPGGYDQIKTQPVKFGRGLKGRHWALRINNQGGEEFYLASGELRTLVKSRRHNA